MIEQIKGEITVDLNSSYVYTNGGALDFVQGQSYQDRNCRVHICRTFKKKKKEEKRRGVLR
jgi:hypothetical protein